MMNRIDAKAKAKSLLREKSPRECLIFFLILFCIMGLPMILQLGLNIDRMISDIIWIISPHNFYNFSEFFISILQRLTSSVVILVISVCIAIIQALAAMLFQASLVRCSLKLSRGDQAIQAVDTLQAFDKLWKYILISLFQKLLLALWKLPSLVLGVVGFAMWNGIRNAIVDELIGKSIALFIFGLVLLHAAVIWSVFITINKKLQYFFSYYICEDNPELGVIACVQKSGQLMEGHKLDLLTTHVSFIGWDWVDRATFVSQVFSVPYRYLTYAVIYQQLNGAEENIRQHTVRPKVVGEGPAIEFISGEYAGTQVPVMGKGEIRIGRDPKQVQIVLSQSNERISGLHCGVRYDSVSDSYFVTDYSTNGTYVDGVRLPTGSTSVRRGTVIKLADGELLCRLS